MLPTMNDFRWGILGPGRIARQFALGVAACPGQRIAAVGSRELSRAQDFARDHARSSQVAVHGSYEALIADPNVDAIYIATPHPAHVDQAVACLNAGRPVLCEKPLAVNSAQVERILAASVAKKTFLMEGMWTRCIPIHGVVKEWIDQGRIGRVRMVQASFGFRAGWDPASRLLDPALAGGGLLDVGVYVVSVALWAMGRAPISVQAAGHRGLTGVDEQAALVLGFSDGGVALLDCAVRTRTEVAVRIYGEEGMITITPPFYKATTAVIDAGGAKEERVCPLRASGFEYEIEEAARCIRAGLIESSAMTHADSRAVMAVLDQARRQIGVSYPCE